VGAAYLFKKMSNVNIRPIGENSPNLITLIGCDAHRNGAKTRFFFF
jgi:hypothetical protein